MQYNQYAYYGLRAAPLHETCNRPSVSVWPVCSDGRSAQSLEPADAPSLTYSKYIEPTDSNTNLKCAYY